MRKLADDFQPVGKYILVEALEPEKLTPAGIIIPDTDRIEKPIARVLKTGGKVTETKTGDVFFHVHFFGVLVSYKGKKAYIMQAQDVIGRF